MLSEDQVYDLGKYMSLSPLEEQYLDTLGRMARAHRTSYQQGLEKNLEALREKAKKLSERIEYDHVLKDQERTTFYSSWKYSALRMACSVGQGCTAEELQDLFRIPRAELQKKLVFLELSGLLIKENSKWRVGNKRTHLDKGSPHLPRHHTNWRLRAIHRSEDISDDEIMYTSPLSLSHKDFQILREKIFQLITEKTQLVKNTEPEVLACINIDLFQIDK